jgi:hypothetical protein
MKNCILFLSLISTLCISSCKGYFADTIEKFDLPYEEKLVVIGFISPQSDVIAISVKVNYPVDGIKPHNDSLVVRNAKVQFISDLDTLVLPFDTLDKDYRVPENTIKIQSQKTYKIIVSAPNRKTVTASCVVPNMVIAKSSVGIDRRASYNTASADSSFEASINFPNGIGEQDYYNIQWEDWQKPIDNQPFLIASSAWLRVHGTDALGATLSSRFFTYLPLHRLEKTRRYNQVRLMTTDYNFFKYHQTLQDAQKGRESPFTEDAWIFSNIENGLGVFGAFNQIVLVL